MKVTLYMAISANGMIAGTHDDTSWISGDEWDRYSQAVRAAGHMIIGHRTYDILTKQPEFAEFKDVHIVVVSSESFPLLSSKHQISTSPQEALAACGDASRVIVAGGSILNASFLRENLVDELILDVEPMVIGTGIPVTQPLPFNLKLELLETKAVGLYGIQLHYKVIKEK